MTTNNVETDVAIDLFNVCRKLFSNTSPYNKFLLDFVFCKFSLILSNITMVSSDTINNIKNAYEYIIKKSSK